MVGQSTTSSFPLHCSSNVHSTSHCTDCSNANSGVFCKYDNSTAEKLSIFIILIDAQHITCLLLESTQVTHYVKVSFRGLGVFSETQLSLLLSTTEGMIGQREVCQAGDANRTQSLLSTAMEEKVKQQDFIDESVFELSNYDIFDSSPVSF